MILQTGEGMAFGFVEHPMSEAPEGRAGQLFVSFPGCTGMVGAKWIGGEWCDLAGQPFPHPPARWYSMEAVDGNARH